MCLCRLKEAVGRKQDNHSVGGALHYLANSLPDILVKLHALPILELGIDAGASGANPEDDGVDLFWGEDVGARDRLCELNS